MAPPTTPRPKTPGTTPAKVTGTTPVRATGRTAVRATGARPAPVDPEAPVPARGLRGALGKFRTNLRQIGQAYKLTVRTDKKLPLWLLGSFLVAFAVVLGIGFLIGAPRYFVFLGVVFGLLASLIVFGRRAERAAYAQLEGRPGAAAAALNTLKRGWTVTPAIAGTRTMEIVHRAVGRPGIVLIGEGPSRGRLAGLLQNEARRHTRVAPGTPVVTVQCGSEQGQVAIGRLPRHLRKLAAVLTPGDVREVNQRLKALKLGTPQAPYGPLPRNARLPRGMRPPTDADQTNGGR